jgi:hypothetical protein
VREGGGEGFRWCGDKVVGRVVYHKANLWKKKMKKKEEEDRGRRHRRELPR